MTNNKARIEKTKTLKRLLLGEYILVHVDPRASNLTLPPHLLQNETVTLKLSRLFRGAMEVDNEKVTAELLFSGTYFTCVVPLDAIWGITSEKGENLIWVESAPKEVLKNMLISQPESSRPSGEEEQGVPKEKLPSKGHLRRVK